MHPLLINITVWVTKITFVSAEPGDFEGLVAHLLEKGCQKTRTRWLQVTQQIPTAPPPSHEWCLHAHFPHVWAQFLL